MPKNFCLLKTQCPKKLIHTIMVWIAFENLCLVAAHLVLGLADEALVAVRLGLRLIQRVFVHAHLV